MKNWQEEFLDFIRLWQNDFGYSPSMREIATSTGLSLSAVHYRIGVLEARGLINRDPRIARSITIIKEKSVSDEVNIMQDIPMEDISPKEAFARLVCAEIIITSLPYSQHVSVAAMLALGLGVGGEEKTAEEVTQAVEDRRNALQEKSATVAVDE